MTGSTDLWAAYTRIFVVELAYWVVSIGMVFVNEFVLSSKILTDDLTVFITIFQILFSLAILLTLNFITKVYLNPAPTQSKLIVTLKDPQSISVSTKLAENEEIDRMIRDDDNDPLIEKDVRTLINKSHTSISSASSSYKVTETDSSDSLMQLFIVHIPQRINFETCKLVFPLSILYIGMLLLNNFCLKYVGVAFYFVSRSLTTVFNVIFTYFLINEPVSRGALLCCAFIVLGFILGIDQESVIGSLSVIGVVFGVASSLFTSLFSIYTKKTLTKLDKNIWQLVLYNNINAILLCTPLLIVHGDVQALISDKVISLPFWFLLSISGVMSFFISIVTNASIKYTSPLTHNISGTAKACFQTVIAVIYYHDKKSTLWWISNITILLASAAYSRIKQLEMKQRSASPPPEIAKKFSGQENSSFFKLKKRPNNLESKSSTNKDCCSVKLQTQDK